jgi:hypothetical protein
MVLVGAARAFAEREARKTGMIDCERATRRNGWPSKEDLAMMGFPKIYG